MKKFAKIALIVVICLFVLADVMSCLSDDEDTPENASQGTQSDSQVNQDSQTTQDSQTAQDSDSSSNESEPLTAQRPETPPLESSGKLGKYDVAIGDYTIEKDHNGNPAIVISYTFTNNDDDSRSAMVSVSEKAFQNGVSLESAYFSDDSILDSSADMKDVQTGASIEIKKAYLLTSETAPVEFEVTEAISMNDDMLGKTFMIDPNGKTEYPTAPEGGISGKLGDYTVSVVSCEIGDNYDDTDVLIVHYGFTNNSKKNASFSVNIYAKLFQNGVQIERAYFADSNESSTLSIKPGVGIEVVEAYKLADLTSPVDIELTESFSLSDEKFKTTVQLK